MYFQIIDSKSYDFISKIYRNDSVVSDRINFDLMKKVKEVQEGKRTCTELYGSLNEIEFGYSFVENRYHGN